MRLWHRLIPLLAVAAILTGTGITAAQAKSHTVSAGIYVQEKSNWCWAAASRTIIHHITGTAASQCKLVEWGKDTSSCANVTGSFGKNVSQALAKGGVGNVGTFGAFTISYSYLQGELDAGRLVMIRWAWSTGGGHMLVLRGYDTSTSTVSFVNPEKSAFQSDTYDHIVQFSTHTWTHTRYDISS